MTGLIRFAAVFVLTVSLGGCSTNPPPPTSTVDSTGSPSLQPGDAVRVQVWREPDLSGTFTVDERGIVTLPLLGESEVTGLAPGQLRAELLTDYREYLQNPAIELTFLRRINILGEVRMPGLYPVDATISFADALALAGGLTPNGNPKKIQLIRDDQVVIKNMDQAMMIGSADVRSGDQLVVGQKGWIARNTGAVVGSFIAATAIVAAAVISN